MTDLPFIFALLGFLAVFAAAGLVVSAGTRLVVTVRHSAATSDPG